MKKIITFIFGLVLTFSLFAEARNALLIANENYEYISNLPNPVKEVRDLKAALEKLGFTVTVLENGNREQIFESLHTFQKTLEKAGGIGFFLYSGHGVQVNGKNYLIPVEADIPDERRVSTRAVDADEVMASMQADTNIIILDACRTNPLPAVSFRSAPRGLALTESKPKNSVIVYSAQPNHVAWDGIFTPILTEKIVEDKEFSAILKDVRKAVQDKTNGEQSPGEYNELVSDVYLAKVGVSSTATVAQTQNTTSTTKVNDGFVFVEGGTFSMGSDNGYNYEKPVHSVTLSSFYMCDHEVTQAEFKAVMGTNPSRHIGNNYPVECVSWNDAIEYCNRLSLNKGLTPCYKFLDGTVICDWYANGYRLPTEAEWEYAARGGNKSLGYTYSGSNNLGFIAWYKENSNNQSHEVKTKLSNELGLYDMIGNVHEWCWDWYESTYYSYSVDTNPHGELTGSYRVIRGGSYSTEVSYSNIFNRSGDTADGVFINLGFRVVRNESINSVPIDYMKLGKQSYYEGDYKKAFEYFSNAGVITDSEAQNILGNMYSLGNWVSQNNIKAFEWYEKSALQGTAAAQYNLGLCYGFGYGVTQDYVKAFEWYEKAAEQGYANAQNNLGCLYYHGNGVAQNYVKAFELFEKSANQGNPVAQSNLGEMYEKGYGIDQNYEKAFEWYNEAAHGGNENAFKWLQNAAEQGNEDAQCELGYMYCYGLGVSQDDIKAFEWFEKAAKQGDVYAQYGLGFMYYNGWGVPQDYIKAFEWFEKAAKQGDVYAQYRLGLMYYNGWGVPQDFVEAKKWYEKSAAQGDPAAIEALQKLSEE